MNFLKKLCEVIIYAILQLCGACSGTDCSFFFTSKVFSIIKYKMYFALSLIFIILTASVACF